VYTFAAGWYLFCGACELESVAYLKEGNFALPTTQQIVTLFGFGQNVISGGDILAYSFIDVIGGSKKRYADVLPTVLYGVSDTFSVLATVPVALTYKEGGRHSSGVEDCFIQAEYAFYNKDKKTYAHQMTAVGNIILPTGSYKKYPPTGFGSPSFSLGITASHMSIDWFVFAVLGAVLTTRHQGGTQFGQSLLYQGGFSRNIAYKSDAWLLNLMVELDGIFRPHDRLDGVKDRNSGGSIFFVAPSLYFATQRFFLHAGIAFPVAQHLFGEQNKTRYIAAINLGWTFHTSHAKKD
jgi:hypothetical protein